MMCSTSKLDPVFIEIGGFPIYWYGVIIAVGAFLGLFIATRESDRLGLQKDLMVDLVVFALPIAILSARAYYVIFEWDRYAKDRKSTRLNSSHVAISYAVFCLK